MIAAIEDFSSGDFFYAVTSVLISRAYTDEIVFSGYLCLIICFIT